MIIGTFQKNGFWIKRSQAQVNTYRGNRVGQYFSDDWFVIEFFHNVISPLNPPKGGTFGTAVIKLIFVYYFIFHSILSFSFSSPLERSGEAAKKTAHRDSMSRFPALWAIALLLFTVVKSCCATTTNLYFVLVSFFF
jgi:hypothetical protein